MQAAMTSALCRFGKMLAISFLGSSVTAFTVYREQAFLPNGSLNYKPALAAASTAFLVSLASSVLHGLEVLLGDSSQATPPIVTIQPPPPIQQRKE